jgi:glutathione-specific gamma-glutamylcyclotransferase
MAEAQPDLWIFAYGSLMWRPDFTFAERHRADLEGFSRALCIHSHLYRGTVERPGLVFGLDRGGSCTGVAFRIAPEDRERTLNVVRLRELVTSVYKECLLPISLSDGRTVTAINYVADQEHPQYAGALPVDDVIRVVLGATGISGRNVDYLWNTQAHLLELGVHDPMLAALCDALERSGGAGPASRFTDPSP